MPDPIARTYLSLAAFYASDPARRASRERDMGLFWRSRNGPSFRSACRGGIVSLGGPAPSAA